MNVLKAVDLLILSLWIAICAVTPEFIWRGARIALLHMDKYAWAAALLFGLILAFCVEPALERLRDGWKGHGAPSAAEEEENATGRLLFTAAEGLVFAIVSLCLHDAISAVLATTAATESARAQGLINGIGLTIAWSAVPFFVTLAWVVALTTRFVPWRWAALTLAVIAPAVTAWVFGWAWQDWFTTEVPALLILAAGYRLMHVADGVAFFRRAAARLGWIAPLWLLGAAVFDAAVTGLGHGQAAIYSHDEFWIDVRFYIGWAVGLLVIPKPPPL